MRRFRYLPSIVVVILTLFATMGCDPEEPELVATAVPTDNPTSMPDPKVTAEPEPVPTERAANAQPTASPQFQVFNVGDTVRLGDLHITVNSVRASLGDNFFTPEEGNYFIYVDVTFRNEGNKPEVVGQSRVPGSGVRGRGSGERETTASSLAGKEESSRKEDNSGQGKDGPAGAIAQGGNGR